MMQEESSLILGKKSHFSTDFFELKRRGDECGFDLNLQLSPFINKISNPTSSSTSSKCTLPIVS